MVAPNHLSFTSPRSLLVISCFFLMAFQAHARVLCLSAKNYHDVAGPYPSHSMALRQGRNRLSFRGGCLRKERLGLSRYDCSIGRVATLGSSTTSEAGHQQRLGRYSKIFRFFYPGFRGQNSRKGEEVKSTAASLVVSAPSPAAKKAASPTATAPKHSIEESTAATTLSSSATTLSITNDNKAKEVTVKKDEAIIGDEKASMRMEQIIKKMESNHLKHYQKYLMLQQEYEIQDDEGKRKRLEQSLKTEQKQLKAEKKQLKQLQKHHKEHFAQYLKSERGRKQLEELKRQKHEFNFRPFVNKWDLDENDGQHHSNMKKKASSPSDSSIIISSTSSLPSPSSSSLSSSIRSSEQVHRQPDDKYDREKEASTLLISAQEFNSRVIAQESSDVDDDGVTRIVAFGHPACRPCKAFMPKFDRLPLRDEFAHEDVTAAAAAATTGTESYGERSALEFYRLSYDRNDEQSRALFSEHKISHTPTTIIFRGGMEVGRYQGFREERLVSAILQALNEEGNSDKIDADAADAAGGSLKQENSGVHRPRRDERGSRGSLSGEVSQVKLALEAKRQRQLLEQQQQQHEDDGTHSSLSMIPDSSNDISTPRGDKSSLHTSWHSKIHQGRLALLGNFARNYKREQQQQLTQEAAPVW